VQSEMYAKSGQGDEINFTELFAVLWAGKKLISGITLVFALASVSYALTLADEYKATAVIAPAQSGGSSMLGSMASQFGGLASLAGINLGGAEGGEAQQALEIMTSQAFITDFIIDHSFEVAVFAAVGWSDSTNKIEIDGDLFDAETKTWVREPPPGKTSEPSSWELYEAFLERLAVSEDKKKGLVSVSIEYFSPQLAREWVDKYVVAINEHMRERKLQEVNRNIQYLEAQIEKTAIADMHEVFYQIIEEQIKSKMLAEASPEYAFSTVNRAMLPEIKSKPKRSIICVLGTLLGGIMATLLVLTRHYAFNSLVRD
jgi:LPS O-antigen subunit length determinant protein (WzzB/FepE family)